MKTYFQTSEGDILPFHSIIRASKRHVYTQDCLRVFFVNGSVDLREKDCELFTEAYGNWLDNSKS